MPYPKNKSIEQKQSIFKKDHWLVMVFCLLAALRVFLFSAGFPFFNNVDEGSHFDLVMKYSHGEVPRSLEPMSVESAGLYARNGTYGYSIKTGQDYKPLNYETCGIHGRNYIDDNTRRISKMINHEATQPPLYYLIAGGWTKLGVVAGLKDITLLYWIRFLNVIFIVLLVLTSYLASLSVFPANRFLIFSVPLIVAVLPQDTYYSIQNDVLSPLCFAFTFVSLVWFLKEQQPQRRHAIILGLSIAATVLVKISNLPLLIVVSLALVYKMYTFYKNKQLKPAITPFVLFAVSAYVPVLIWVAWNFFTQGDITGSEGKIQFLGWTRKPFVEWLDHPLFKSTNGVVLMWKELMSTFWRGEFIWAGERVALPLMDFLYWVSSLVFVVITMVVVQRKVGVFGRNVNRFAFVCFASMLLFMVLLSIRFDFGECPYPSGGHPYFTSGRLISGALLPFVLLYAQGFDWLFSWIKNERLRFLLLIAALTVVVVSEIVASQQVFLSNFNWFRFN